MDVSAMFTVINNHGFDDTDTPEKMEVINDAVWDIESREPWPFLEKTIALNTSGASSVPTNMPADFKRVLWLYDIANGVTLWPERLSTVRDRFGNVMTTVASPQMYYFIGNQLNLYPIPPASTGGYQLDYFAQQTVLNSASLEANILIPARHHRTIVLGALWRLYNLEDDPEQGQLFQTDYENRIQQMKQDLFRRQEQRADNIFVIDEDDEYPAIYV